MQGLAEAVEEFVLPEGWRLLVARLGASFFVLRGRRVEDVRGYEVSEPFESCQAASKAARALLARAMFGGVHASV